MRHGLTMARMNNHAGNNDLPELTLGWRLRMAMEKAHLRSEEMAEILGVHRGTIARWTHDITPPREIYLHKWAEVCHVRYEWLVGQSGHRRATDQHEERARVA